MVAGGTKPRFVPTRIQRGVVSALVAVGVPQASIAAYLNIGLTTLKRNFRDEIKHGHARIESAISGKVIQAALDGKLAACFFVLKTRFGWRETNQHSFLGKDGQPIDINKLDPATLRELFDALREKADGRGRGRTIEAERATTEDDC